MSITVFSQIYLLPRYIKNRLKLFPQEYVKTFY